MGRRIGSLGNVRHSTRGNPRPAIVLTANRRRGRLLVLVSGEPVWLSGVVFSTLCELVSARLTTSMGYVSAPPMTVCRLRQSISSALEHPCDAKELIETGIGAEYRLTPDPSQIALDDSFWERPVPNVIGEEVLKELRRWHGRL